VNAGHIAHTRNKYISGFDGETYRKATTWKIQVDGRIIIKYFKVITWKVVDLIHLAQERDKLCVPLHRTIKPSDFIKCREFF